MARRATMWILVLALAAALIALALVLVVGRGSGSVSVKVAGRSEKVAKGTTLGQAVAMFRVRPPAGDLVDVEGGVLRRGAFPGSILLDGRAAATSTHLRTGDRISVAAGRDRREPLSRKVVRVPGGIAADPEFFLARTPGNQLVIRGATSHKLVSVRFLPNGRPARLARAVALTFDDGPSPQYTPRILATLKRLHVRATFFCIGYLADEHPRLVRNELHAGMTVGNHSYNHPEVPPFDQLPPRLVADEIALGAESLRRAGASSTLFRPPGGSYSTAVVRAARQRGERIVLWSVDPRDWQPGTTARQITHRVLADVRPGSIIELHDGGGNRSATLTALPAIIKGIRHHRLRLVAITAP